MYMVILMKDNNFSIFIGIGFYRLEVIGLQFDLEMLLRSGKYLYSIGKSYYNI